MPVSYSCHKYLYEEIDGIETWFDKIGGYYFRGYFKWFNYKEKTIRDIDEDILEGYKDKYEIFNKNKGKIE